MQLVFNHSAVSAFLELQHSHSHKYFDPWYVKHLLSLLRVGHQPLPLLILKLLRRLLPFKHLMWQNVAMNLLCIDNQHLFLQHHVAIFYQHLVVRQIGKVIVHLDFIFNLIPVLIFVLFLLKAYLCCTELFRKKSDGSLVSPLFWVTVDSMF